MCSVPGTSIFNKISIAWGYLGFCPLLNTLAMSHSLSCVLPSFFLWRFMGLSPLSPSSVSIGLSLSNLSIFNQLLFILPPFKSLFMKAGILVLFLTSPCVARSSRTKNGIPDYLPPEWVPFHMDVGDGYSMGSNSVTSENNVKRKSPNSKLKAPKQADVRSW